MNFTPISKLIGYEFRRFKGFSALALIFILLLPTLYGGIYLSANWDLYSHTDRLKVAVVNLDEGAEYEGDAVEAGAMFEDSLREQGRFDWQFLGRDAEAAAAGMESGEYAMVMTVPKDFSAKLASAGDLSPKRAGVLLQRDDANGFIAGMLTSQIENAISASLDSAISETYFKALLGSLEEVRSGMVEAAGGSSELRTHLEQLREGTEKLNGSVKEMDLSELKAQMDAIPGAFAGFETSLAGFQGASQNIEGGANQIVGAGQTIKTAATDIATHLESASGFLANDMATLSGQLQRTGDTLKGLGSGDQAPLTQAASNLTGAQQALQALAAAHPDIQSDPNFAKLASSLQGAGENVQAVGAGIQSAGNTLNGITVAEGAGRLKADLEAIGEDDRRIGAAGDAMVLGLTLIQKGGEDSKALMASVNSQMAEMKTSVDSMTTQGNELTAGMERLSEAIGTLDGTVPQLVEGAEKLAGGLGSGSAQVPLLSEGEQASFASVMSKPIDVTQEVEHSAGFYGRGLAPMFFSLGLWIATISTFLVVRTISGRALTARGSSLRTWLFGFGPVATVGLAGALSMGLGLWPLLGLDPEHPWLYLLLLIVTPLSFMGMAYAVRVAIGSPQTAIFLVLLILQLPSCGGTFPTSMLSGFWQAIGTIAPMHYSVDAFRVAISGGSLATYWTSIAVLGGIAIVAALLSAFVVRRRELFRMRDLHPPLATGASTGENAFMVRPR